MTANPRDGTWSASLLFTALAIVVIFGLTASFSYQLAKQQAQKNVGRAHQAILLQNSDQNNAGGSVEQGLIEALQRHSIFVATITFTDRKPLHYAPVQSDHSWVAVAAVDIKNHNNAYPDIPISSVSFTSRVPVRPPWLLLFILTGFAGFFFYSARSQVQAAPETTPVLRELDSLVEQPLAEISAPLERSSDSPLAESSQIIQRELALAQQSAIEANRFKTKLIASTSHEILTPLNSVLGFANLLKNKFHAEKNSPLNSDEQDTLEKLELIVTNAEHINALINDLVVLSHENRQSLRLNYRKTSIAALVNDTAASFENEILRKGLQLETLTSDVGELTLWTDPLRLRQILYNLLTNAVRYTQRGRITAIATVDNPTTPSLLTIKITDTGSGIDKEKLPVLFSEFVRGNESVQTDQPGLGLGLGLSIVHSLTQLLNGTINVESSVGKGSTFSVTIPFRQPPEKAPDENTRPEHSNVENAPEVLKLLVVDDMPANALLVKEQLKDYRCDITVAHSGSDAIALTLSQPFDAILLDIRMQPMSGQQILAKIRENERYASTPVIAFTAHKSEYDRQELMKYGFTDVIHKPVYQETLVRTLNLSVVDTLSPDTRADSRHLDKQAVNTGQQGCANTVFDTQLALKKCRGNAETARQIVDLVIEEMRQKSDDYKRGKLGSGEVLIDNIHRLNGTAALSGTPRLKETINELESILVSSGNSDQNTETSTLLQNLFVEIDTFLNWANSSDFDQLFKQAQQ